MSIIDRMARSRSPEIVGLDGYDLPEFVLEQHSRRANDLYSRYCEVMAAANDRTVRGRLLRNKAYRRIGADLITTEIIFDPHNAKPAESLDVQRIHHELLSTATLLGHHVLKTNTAVLHVATFALASTIAGRYFVSGMNEIEGKIFDNHG